MKQKSVTKYQCKNGEWHDSSEEVHGCDMYHRLRKLHAEKRIRVPATETLGRDIVLVLIAAFLVENSILAEQLIQEYLDSLTIHNKESI